MTSTSRPRHSILSLFDPLASTEPSTPPRNDSPSADSDKENENPPRNDLTLSTFFNRTYKPVHPLPKPLRRRLIDVGDVTVDDVDPWHSDEEEDSDGLDMNDFEDNENDTLTFRQMAEAATPKVNRPSAFKTPSPLGTRTPLSELTLDHEATPLARDRTLRNPPSSIRSKLAEVHFPEIVVCAASPNRQSGRNIDRQEECSAPLHEDELGTCTSLDVNSNPLLNSVSSINLPSSSATGSLISETVIPAIFTPSASIASISDEPFTPGIFDNVRLRPNPPSTSSLDQSRRSVDLQSSFQFHFNDETHFDLLNDKVSFFNASKNGHSSYLDEDSFDISFGDSTPSELEEIVQTPSATKQTFSEPPCRSPKTSTQAKRDSIEQPFSVADKENTTPSDTSPVSSRGSPSSIPIERARPLETVTPQQPKAGPVAPPPVMGLRIVKRPQLATQKPIAPKTTASPGRLVPRKSLASLTKSPARSSASGFAEVPPVPSCRSTTSTQTVTSLPSRPRVATVEAPKSSLSRATSNAASFSGDGPRRVLVSDESEKKPTSRPTSRTLAGGSTTSLHVGPRRIVPVGERPSIAKGSTSGAGLKHSSSTSAIPKPASRTTAGSSLPQPVSRTSRLPAPSVGIRSSGLPARDRTIRGVSTTRRV